MLTFIKKVARAVKRAVKLVLGEETIENTKLVTELPERTMREYVQPWFFNMRALDGEPPMISAEEYEVRETEALQYLEAHGVELTPEPVKHTLYDRYEEWKQGINHYEYLRRTILTQRVRV